MYKIKHMSCLGALCEPLGSTHYPVKDVTKEEIAGKCREFWKEIEELKAKAKKE